MELKASSILRLIISSVFLPIVIPYIIYRVVNAWKQVTRQQDKLADKVVLLTGASSGLGEALAFELYRAGCRLILASRRVEELERVRSKLISYRSKDSLSTYMPTILQLDLSDLNAIPAKIEEALRLHGKIDILINNGGISYRGDILKTSVDVDVKIMVVNYFGQVAVTKAVLPSMLQNNGGHIVGISSVQGRIAIPYRSAYAASKHALQAFFDSLRAEMSGNNIKVTLISPGYMQTNLSLNALTGNGRIYGVTDRNTATGMPADEAAQQIIEAIVLEKKEVILSTFLPFAAIILRTLCPPAYFAFMRQRAKEQRQTMQEEDVHAGGEIMLRQ